MTSEQRRVLRRLARLGHEAEALLPDVSRLHLDEVPDVHRIVTLLSEVRVLSEQRRVKVAEIESELAECGINLTWHPTTGADLLAFLGRG